jgi:hypothetical protein
VRSRSITLSLVCLFASVAVRAQEQGLLSSTASPILVKSGGAATPGNCRILFLGFVGALEPANNKHSGVVQIRQTLQGREYADVCANSFSPYTWLEGRDWLMKYFPWHPGPLTAEELRHVPKVILMGHSMGGWAVVSVARELRARAIPVELTIQVDSVGITDYTIPRNVKSAAIFHANDVLMFMTTKRLRCEDPTKTKLLDSVTVTGAGHESITRDPRIRELVIDTVASLRITSAEKVSPEPARVSSTPVRGEDQE